jgi:hypothetical protein
LGKRAEEESNVQEPRERQKEKDTKRRELARGRILLTPKRRLTGVSGGVGDKRTTRQQAATQKGKSKQASVGSKRGPEEAPTLSEREAATWGLLITN